mmetsp:Transcript_35733/g.66187  ORF Transcript_35733/g.66187 Transcript_35733/m.66187 type:complete len:219 (+) Transcript_35733:783-1439(+)
MVEKLSAHGNCGNGSTFYWKTGEWRWRCAGWSWKRWSSTETKTAAAAIAAWITTSYRTSWNTSPSTGFVPAKKRPTAEPRANSISKTTSSSITRSIAPITSRNCATSPPPTSSATTAAPGGTGTATAAPPPRTRNATPTRPCCTFRSIGSRNTTSFTPSEFRGGSQSSWTFCSTGPTAAKPSCERTLNSSCPSPRTGCGTPSAPPAPTWGERPEGAGR